MILKEWIQKQPFTVHHFAQKIGVVPSSLYRSISGKIRLSAAVAKLIEHETKGEVKRWEALWPEDYGTEQQKKL